ncbi:hypothetical protein HK101_008063 [Irineochytrium annulatum]|nr:hypothetical protein HK101_008063 [Irineochytrium annulatum]
MLSQRRMSSTGGPIVTSLEGWKMTRDYMEMDEEKKATSVPPPRGDITDIAAFLKAIGRGCDELAPKFKTWDELFTVSSFTMKSSLGVPHKKRKYILAWREWYRRGIDPYHVIVPKRRHKYLRERRAVQAARKRKAGGGL